LTSLARVGLSTTYARETRYWAAQAIGGDWVNLCNPVHVIEIGIVAICAQLCSAVCAVV